MQSFLNSLLPIILLAFVNLAVIFRRIGKLEIPAWTAFMAAALLIIIFSPGGYEKALIVVGKQFDILIFLFSMFVLVTALEMSGVLDNSAKWILTKSKSPNGLLIWVFLGFGLAASVLINDTIAIIAPIILIAFSKQINRDIKPYILAVAFSLTFGSALLPTGNPQNYILATAGGIRYLEFFIWAFFPSIFSLFGAYLILRVVYKEEFTNKKFPYYPVIFDKYEYQRLAKPAMLLLLVLLIGLISSSFLNFSITFLFLIVSGIFLFFVNDRDIILERINWGILFFFAGMFIVIDAVTNSDLFLDFILPEINKFTYDFEGYIVFIIVIFVACQLLSNVPVAIILANILPLTQLNHPIFWIASALTTTFAGASTILGAASNIIVVESASNRGVKISWFEFTKLGIPISFISLISLVIFGAFYFLFLF